MPYVPPTFPTLVTNAITQYPYVEVDEFYTAVSDAPCGKSFTRSYNAIPMKAFTASFPCITRAELTLIEDFFNLMRGRTGEFVWFDDNGTAYPQSRFDQDSLDVQYVDAGHYAVTLRIVVRP